MFTSMTTNLMVESVDESLAFYKDKLGFVEVATVPSESGALQFAILQKDGLMLMFQERENLVSEYPILQTSKVQPSATLYIAVDNFDELYQELEDSYKILTEVHTTFYGSKEFAIADNNGYVLTFTEKHSS